MSEPQNSHQTSQSKALFIFAIVFAIIFAINPQATANPEISASWDCFGGFPETLKTTASIYQHPQGENGKYTGRIESPGKAGKPGKFANTVYILEKSQKAQNTGGLSISTQKVYTRPSSLSTQKPGMALTIAEKTEISGLFPGPNAGKMSLFHNQTPEIC